MGEVMHTTSKRKLQRALHVSNSPTLYLCHKRAVPQIDRSYFTICATREALDRFYLN